MMIKNLLICIGLGVALPITAHAANDQRAQAAVDALQDSLAAADEAIRVGTARDAIDALAFSIANAELSIALADARESIDTVSDEQMLAELDTILAGQTAEEAQQLIMAVVAERPVLAAAITDIAIKAGLDESRVANAIVSGLGEAPATAAGQ